MVAAQNEPFAKGKSIAFLVALLLAAGSTSGCLQNDTLTENEISAAIEVVPAQDPEALLDEIRSLVSAHESETPTHPLPNDPPYRRVEAARWVSERFEELGYESQLEEGVFEGLPVTNVIAELEGDEEPDRLIILGAHHDVWWTAADDNSSGVVCVIAAARALREQVPRKTIRFVTFDQEEEGSYGSALHFDGVDPKTVDLMVNVDGVAYADHEKGSQKAPFGFQLPSRGDFLAAFGNQPADDQVQWATQLSSRVPHPVRVFGVFGVGSNGGPLLEDLHRSDHTHMWKKGRPAIFLSDTSESRNPHYHRESDTVETLDGEFFAGVVETTIALVWAAANR